jgi:hypothetical protein
MSIEELNAGDFAIHFESERELGANYDAESRFIRRFYGSIRQHDTNELAGRISGARILIDQADWEGYCIFELMDLSSHYLDVYEELIDGEAVEWKYMDNDCHGMDILLIENVDVDPKFRGLRLGQWAALSAIEFYGSSCDYIITNPCPTSDELDHDKKAFAKARRGLQKYWSEIGFKRAGKTNLFYLDMQKKLIQPKQPSKSVPAPKPLTIQIAANSAINEPALSVASYAPKPANSPKLQESYQ